MWFEFGKIILVFAIVIGIFVAASARGFTDNNRQDGMLMEQNLCLLSFLKTRYLGFE